MSIAMTGSAVFMAEIVPGHVIKVGIRIPPSWFQPWPARSGKLLVGHEADMQDPPLSEVKTMIVSFVIPSSSKELTTLPMFVSRFSTMAA